MRGGLVRPSRETVLTGGLGAAIVVVLTVLQLGLPPGIHDALVFDHSAPTVWALWTSAYVHRGLSHLARNLLGFVLAGIPTWLIFAWRGRQQNLRQLMVVFLAVFPPVIALSSFAVFQYGLGADAAATRGFSGIVTAVFGLLFIAVLEIVYDYLGWSGASGVGLSVVLATMVVMLVNAGEASVTVLALGVVGIVLSVSLVVPGFRLGKVRETSPERVAPAVLVGYGILVLVVTLPGLFPIQWVQADHVTNIFAHLTGFLLGVCSGVVASWRVRR